MIFSLKINLTVENAKDAEKNLCNLRNLWIFFRIYAGWTTGTRRVRVNSQGAPKLIQKPMRA